MATLPNTILLQTNNTCWFYSVLNGMINSNMLKPYIQKKLETFIATLKDNKEDITSYYDFMTNRSLLSNDIFEVADDESKAGYMFFAYLNDVVKIGYSDVYYRPRNSMIGAFDIHHYDVYHPIFAHEKIMAKLGLTFERVLYKDFNKIDIKLEKPEPDMIVVDSNTNFSFKPIADIPKKITVNGQNYSLSHSTLVVWFQKESWFIPPAHSIAGINNQDIPQVIDSNQQVPVAFDWTKRDSYMIDFTKSSDVSKEYIRILKNLYMTYRDDLKKKIIGYDPNTVDYDVTTDTIPLLKELQSLFKVRLLYFCYVREGLGTNVQTQTSTSVDAIVSIDNKDTVEISNTKIVNASKQLIINVDLALAINMYKSIFVNGKYNNTVLPQIISGDVTEEQLLALKPFLKNITQIKITSIHKVYVGPKTAFFCCRASVMGVPNIWMVIRIRIDGYGAVPNQALSVYITGIQKSTNVAFDESELRRCSRCALYLELDLAEEIKVAYTQPKGKEIDLKFDHVNINEQQFQIYMEKKRVYDLVSGDLLKQVQGNKVICLKMVWHKPEKITVSNNSVLPSVATIEIEETDDGKNKLNKLVMYIYDYNSTGISKTQIIDYNFAYKVSKVQINKKQAYEVYNLEGKSRYEEIVDKLESFLAEEELTEEEIQQKDGICTISSSVLHRYLNKNILYWNAMRAFGRVNNTELLQQIQQTNGYDKTVHDREYVSDYAGTHILLYKRMEDLADLTPFSKYLVDLFNQYKPPEGTGQTVKTVEPREDYIERATFVSPETMSKPIHVIFVAGLGCKYENLKEIHSYFTNFVRTKTELKPETKCTIEVSCNNSYLSQLANVTKTVMSIKPSKKISYIQDLYKKIQDYLYGTGSVETPHTVIVMGFSYGGSVVSRIAQLFSSTHDDLSKIPDLYMATFGSIYIPKPLHTIKVNLTHYLLENDVAMMCNKKSRDALIRFNEPKVKVDVAAGQILPVDSYASANSSTTETNEIINEINNEYKNIRYFRWVSPQQGKQQNMLKRYTRIKKYQLTGTTPSESATVGTKRWDIHSSYDSLFDYYLFKAINRIISTGRSQAKSAPISAWGGKTGASPKQKRSIATSTSKKTIAKPKTKATSTKQSKPTRVVQKSESGKLKQRYSKAV